MMCSEEGRFAEGVGQDPGPAQVARDLHQRAHARGPRALLLRPQISAVLQIWQMFLDMQ